MLLLRQPRGSKGKKTTNKVEKGDGGKKIGGRKRNNNKKKGGKGAKQKHGERKYEKPRRIGMDLDKKKRNNSQRKKDKKREKKRKTTNTRRKTYQCYIKQFFFVFTDGY